MKTFLVDWERARAMEVRPQRNGVYKGDPPLKRDGKAVERTPHTVRTGAKRTESVSMLTDDNDDGVLNNIT